MVGCLVLFLMCSASADQRGVSKAQHSDGLVLDTAGGGGDINTPYVNLSDELHVKNAVLEGLDAVHYYRFIALRGQKVLLAYPLSQEEDIFWDVEYFEAEEWKPMIGSGKVFDGIEPGGEVKVRIVHKKDLAFSARKYGVVLGSYPVLKEYKLHDQHRMKRIPSGYTEPPFLPVQGAIEAYLEANFTDSTGAPLMGGMGHFTLDLAESRLRPIDLDVVSDEAGKVKKTISFERCYGGRESKDISAFYGGGTWKSYYYVGEYSLKAAFLDAGTMTAPQEQPRIFGHVCGHRKIKR